MKQIQIKELEPYPRLFQGITNYYPIGLRSYSNEFNDYEGIRRLEEVVNEKVADQTNYERFWENGVKQDIEKEIGYKINGATFGFVPSYGGIINLDEHDKGHINGQLHFYISFIDNFFVVQIRNQCVDTSEENDSGYGHVVKKIVVSPTEGFHSKLFLKVELAIRKRFKDALFLPYSLYSQPLGGLSVIYADEFDYPIGGAFFHADIPSTRPKEIIGNVNYKLNELKEG